MQVLPPGSTGGPSRLFILRPVATTLLMVAILLAGIIGYRFLPVSALPEVDYPTIQVVTLYPGASPDVVTSAITAPLERQFGQMSGLKQMSSQSSGGASVVTLQFQLTLSLDVAEQEVQAAINAATNLLPSDLPNPPVYSKVNPADPPIMTLAVTSSAMPMTQVEDMVETRVAQKISQVSGVGLVTLSGGQRPAVRVKLNAQAIAALGEDPQAARWTTAGGTDAVEALAALTPDYLEDGRGGRVGVVMQGVVAAGPPYMVDDFAGLDLPLLMSGYLTPEGAYDATEFGIFAHAEAMLGLLNANEPVAPPAVDLLLSLQTGGDWGDPDSHGIALQVLGGLARPARPGTMAALHAAQNVEGGWGFAGATSPSTSSEVVQGLIDAGQNPYGPQWSRVVAGRLTNAADAVLALQDANGCWPNAFGPGDDPYSTTDAVLLLAGQPGWGFSQVFTPILGGG